jgi:hypothetical protein
MSLVALSARLALSASLRLFRSARIPALIFLLPLTAFACEIRFNDEAAGKDKYTPGQVVIFKVRMDLTHNNCPVEPKDTKLQGIGVKILGATDWKSPTPNVWERKIKAQIISTKDGKVTLTARRSCDKDGAWATFSMLAEPLAQ